MSTVFSWGKLAVYRRLTEMGHADLDQGAYEEGRRLTRQQAVDLALSV